jgi:hypothetical protein
LEAAPPFLATAVLVPLLAEARPRLEVPLEEPLLEPPLEAPLEEPPLLADLEPPFEADEPPLEPPLDAPLEEPPLRLPPELLDAPPFAAAFFVAFAMLLEFLG